MFDPLGEQTLDPRAGQPAGHESNQYRPWQFRDLELRSWDGNAVAVYLHRSILIQHDGADVKSCIISRAKFSLATGLSLDPPGIVAHVGCWPMASTHR